MQHTKVFIQGFLETDPFFYIIRHKSSNKLYAGYKSSKRGKYTCNSSTFMTKNGYQTSSKIVKEIIKDEGLESFEVIRIRHFETKCKTCAYEARFLCKVKARHNSVFINQTNGGKEFIRKYSFKGRTRWNNGVIEKYCKDCPDGLDWTHGPIISDKRREGLKKNTGCKFWNNGIICKRSINQPGSDWVSGRFKFSDEVNKNCSTAHIGVKMWNDGTINKWFREDPGEGWSLGKLKS